MKIRIIIIILYLTKAGLIISQNNICKIDSIIKNSQIENNLWVTELDFLDTIYFPERKPKPVMMPLEAYKDNERNFDSLHIHFQKIHIDTLKGIIKLSGIITGGWDGSGSNVLIMTGIRNDTIRKYVHLSHQYREEIPIETSRCIKLVQSDYFWSEAANEKLIRKFEGSITYKSCDDILFFGMENCYSILFDLRQIRYGLQH